MNKGQGLVKALIVFFEHSIDIAILCFYNRAKYFSG